ncbi:hypothetical protein BS78_04G207500 [Paspalum vaginatum]|nr:hypothetical protein BS78_04G207500 [Paspalum vaginatum]
MMPDPPLIRLLLRRYLSDRPCFVPSSGYYTDCVPGLSVESRAAGLLPSLASLNSACSGGSIGFYGVVDGDQELKVGLDLKWHARSGISYGWMDASLVWCTGAVGV